MNTNNYQYNLLVFVLLVTICCGCSSDKTGGNVDCPNTTSNLSFDDNQVDSIFKTDISGFITLDTIWKDFRLEDVGTEGNEGIACYVNNKLTSISLIIYTSMWEINLIYAFNQNSVTVKEEKYNTYFNNKSLIEKKVYIMDYKGNLFPKHQINKYEAIYSQLIEVIPFVISTPSGSPARDFEDK